MGTLAAVAAAMSGLAALSLYLVRRYDSPEQKSARREADETEAMGEFDRALGGSDAKDVTRMFSELDDRADTCRLRHKDIGDTR